MHTQHTTYAAGGAKKESLSHINESCLIWTHSLRLCPPRREEVVLAAFSPCFYEIKIVPNTPKISLGDPARRTTDFWKKRVFWGGKGHDPEQNENLEKRNKTPREIPENKTQCKNPPAGIPDFGWRAAAAGLEPLAAARPSGIRIIVDILTQIDWHLTIQNTDFVCIKFPPPISSPFQYSRGWMGHE